MDMYLKTRPTKRNRHRSRQEAGTNTTMKMEKKKGPKMETKTEPKMETNMEQTK